MQNMWHGRKHSLAPAFEYPRRRGLTVIEILILVTLISMLVTLFLPAVQQAREAARRTQCKNNLRQIGLAFLNHESQNGRIPSNGWGYGWLGVPTRGTGLDQPGGWIFSLLPYLDAGSRLEFNPFGPNAAVEYERLVGTPFPLIECPSRQGENLGLGPDIRYAPQSQYILGPIARTDYAANSGDHVVGTAQGPDDLSDSYTRGIVFNHARKNTGVIFAGSTTRFADLIDGSTNTLLAGEKWVSTICALNLPGCERQDTAFLGYNQPFVVGDSLDLKRWTNERPVRDSDELSRQANLGFGGPHIQGVNYLFCDGSVRTVSFEIDQDVHKSLGNRSDGAVFQVE